MKNESLLIKGLIETYMAVSYTHLDVYKRQALDFMKIGYRRNVGEVVSIKNYVGLIQMKNGFQIQVLPKLSLIHI